MTRYQRRYVEAVAWVIGSARRVTEDPQDGNRIASLRHALACFDVVAKENDPKPRSPAVPRLVCPDGGGRCSSKCELAEGCPGPVPNPARQPVLATGSDGKPGIPHADVKTRRSLYVECSGCHQQIPSGEWDGHRCEEGLSSP